MMTLNASRAVSPTVLNGLVGAWCPSLGPSGYTLLDRSGRGHHGTLTNMDAGSDWVGTPGGWALDFDGTNDHVVLDQQSNLMSNPLTLSGWLNTATTNNRAAVVGSVTTAGNAANWFVTVNFSFPGKLNFWNNAGGPFLHSSAAVNTGEWVHWAVTRDADGLNARIWINGRLDASGTSPFSPQFATSQITAISQAGGFAGYYMEQQCADLGIWHRTLTGAEVGALHRAGQSGLGRLLAQRRRRVYGISATAAKPYLFLNRGQVIGGGML